MRTKFLGRLMACVVLAAFPLMISTFSNAQAPPPRPAPIMPPGIPPTQVVDLSDAGAGVDLHRATAAAAWRLGLPRRSFRGRPRTELWLRDSRSLWSQGGANMRCWSRMAAMNDGH